MGKIFMERRQKKPNKMIKIVQKSKIPIFNRLFIKKFDEHNKFLISSQLQILFSFQV